MIKDSNGIYIYDRYVDIIYYSLYVYEDDMDLYFEICIYKTETHGRAKYNNIGYIASIQIDIISQNEVFKNIEYVPMFEIIFDDLDIILNDNDIENNHYFLYNYVNHTNDIHLEYLNIDCYFDFNPDDDMITILDFSWFGNDEKDPKGIAFLNLNLFNNLNEHRIRNKIIHKELMSIVHHTLNLGYSYYLEYNCSCFDGFEILTPSLKVSSVLLDIKSRNVSLYNNLNEHYIKKKIMHEELMNIVEINTNH
jgi:hypothetical protein